MPRQWTPAERAEHAVLLMKRRHQERPFRHFALPEHVRAAVAEALHQAADPRATLIARRFDVAHSTVCIIARAEGIRLRIGRRSRAEINQQETTEDIHAG